MKKLLVLGLGLIALAGLAGCSNKPKDDIKYDYDGKGVLVSVVTSQLNKNNQIAVNERKDTIYNEKGWTMFEYTYTVMRNKYYLYRTIQYEYNEIGRISKVTNKADDMAGIVTEYEYEGNLLIKETVTEGSKVTTTNYTYDENKNKISSTTRGGSYVDSEYEYDENNNCIKSTQLRSYNSGESYGFGSIHEYTYDENKRILTDTFYDLNTDGIHWTTENKKEYEYDKNNNLKSQIMYFMYNDEWTEHEKHEYTYNSKNSLLLDKIYSYETSWVLDEEYEYKYDENDNRISLEWSRNFNEKWVTGRKTEYEYNKDNKVIKEKTSQLDSVTNKLVHMQTKETKYTYYK